MKKFFRANLTIEAAVILPLVMLMFAGILTTMFYYHDKNIITGASYEVLTIGSMEEEPKKEEIGKQFQERLNRKLILFSKIYVDIWIEDHEIIMYCRAAKGRFHLEVQVSMSRTDPERYIRNIRRIQKIENEIGEL